MRRAFNLRIWGLAAGCAGALALSAPSAFAYTGTATCHKDPGVGPVSVTLAGRGVGQIAFTRSGTDLAISAVTDTLNPVNSPVPCGPDSAPALDEITSVNVTDESFYGGPEVLIDQSHGPLGPGAGADVGVPEIEFYFFVDGEPDNDLVIKPLSGADDVINFGTLPGIGANGFHPDMGVNLNGDADGDDIRLDAYSIKGVRLDSDYAGESNDDVITFDGSQPYFTAPFIVANPRITGGGGDDYLTAAPSEYYGSFSGGAGDDTLIGATGSPSPSAPSGSLIGGPGHDLIQGGPISERIDVKDGEPDTVTCDGGTDVVTNDSPPLDSIASDCEQFDFVPAAPIPPGGGPNPSAKQADKFDFEVLEKRIPGSLAGLASRGVSVRIRCSEACKGEAEVRIRQRLARLLGIGRVIARGQFQLPANKARWTELPLTFEAARAIRSVDRLENFHLGIRFRADPVV